MSEPSKEYQVAKAVQEKFKSLDKGNFGNINIQALLHWWKTLVRAPNQVLAGLDLKMMVDQTLIAAEMVISYENIFVDGECELGSWLVAQRAIGRFEAVFSSKVSYHLHWKDGKWVQYRDKQETDKKHKDLEKLCMQIEIFLNADQ